MQSYEEIVENMKNLFNQQAGYSADEASDIGVRIRVLAGEIFNLQTYLDWIKQQAFPQTAQGEYLDYHAQMRGLHRKDAVKSVGSVRFSIPEASEVNIEIPQGTIISTSGETPISFQTMEYTCINAGDTSVDVNAEAVDGGVNGNVTSGKISVIVTMTAENLIVNNPSAFTLGADAEDDETLRQRVVNSMKFIINGTNKEYYTSLAKTISGVECVNVVPYKYGRGSVAIYISGKDSALTSQTVTKVKDLLSEQREVNVSVYVFAAKICKTIIEVDVTLEDGYDIEEVQNRVSEQISEILESYNVGQSLTVAVINDVLFHTEGIKNFEVLSNGTSGLTAADNEKLVLYQVNLKE